MKTILLIDDDPGFCRYMAHYVKTHHPNLRLITCTDPLRGLTYISPSLDLLILDWEMPVVDGKKLLAYALEQGVRRDRILILSAREAEDLHRAFGLGECLAVLNKHEARQQEVLAMILEAVEQRPGPNSRKNPSFVGSPPQ